MKAMGWLSAISHLLYYASGRIRQAGNRWWDTTGRKAARRWLAGLVGLAVVGFVALATMNYVYRTNLRQQPPASLTFGGKEQRETSGETSEGKVSGPVMGGSAASGRLSLGPDPADLFSLAVENGSDESAPVVQEEAAVALASPRPAESTNTSGTESLPAAGRVPVDPTAMIWPVQGHVQVGYGWVRHPVYRDWRFHPGIELDTLPTAPVRAALDGRVVAIDSDRIQGLTAVLAHGDGWETIYRRLSHIRVQEGQTVSKGTVIALVSQQGQAGGEKRGRVVFEIRRNGTPVDPRQYLP